MRHLIGALVQFRIRELLNTADYGYCFRLLLCDQINDGKRGVVLQFRLVPAAPPPGQAVPFATEQVDLLGQVRSAVLAGEFDQAGHALGAFLSGHSDR